MTALRRLRGDRRRGACRGFLLRLPCPGHELGDAIGGVVGKPGEDVGEPGAGIDVVKLTCLDHRIDGCGATTPGVRAGEGPIAAPDGHVPEGPFGGIVNGYGARGAPFPTGVHGQRKS